MRRNGYRAVTFPVTGLSEDRAMTTYRFPCGHVEAKKSADARRKLKARAAWLSCRRCNVVAIAVKPKPVISLTASLAVRPDRVGHS